MDKNLIRRRLIFNESIKQELSEACGLSVLGGSALPDRCRLSRVHSARRQRMQVAFNKHYSRQIWEFASELLKNFTHNLYSKFDFPSLLMKTAEILKDITKSSGAIAYTVNKRANELVECVEEGTGSRIAFNARTVEAFVATSRECIMVEDVFNDGRFFGGSLTMLRHRAKATVCVPVIAPTGDCIAVIELYRVREDEVFSDVDLQTTIAMTGWIGAAVHQYEKKIAMEDKMKINSALLDMTSRFFSQIIDFEEVLISYITFAKNVLNAERGSFYLLDTKRPGHLADLYEESVPDGIDPITMIKRKTKVDLETEHKAAASVVVSGKILNVRNVQICPHLDGDDVQVRLKARAVLCAPIRGRNKIVGAMQLINKKDNGEFTLLDENNLKSICTYCALSLHFVTHLHSARARKSDNVVVSDVLVHHMLPCEHDKEDIFEEVHFAEIPEDFLSFQWYFLGSEDQMPQLALHMFSEVLEICKLDVDRFKVFILAIRDGYRQNPYHNWDHAFNVCHCMYNILKRNMDVFTDMEIAGLLIAAICHDIDHRGFTNNFLFMTNDEMAQLYPTSPLENHHFQTTMMMLKGFDLLDQLISCYSKDIIQEIKDSILATDLVFYFQWRSKLLDILDDNIFVNTNPYHRFLMKCIMMTSSDLSGQCKTFPVAKVIVKGLYGEFYKQGDREKQLGFCPLSMMDREKQHLIPQDQIQFISVVCLPCVSLLIRMLPNTQDLYHQCYDLRDKWREVLASEVEESYGPVD